ncbi:hypothetical protein GW813_09115 [bacterium]|nr:hypothetical protein [bacterium]
MSQEPLRVEFRVELGNRRPVPKPEPGAKAERQRRDRAARRARNLALAYHIDSLVRRGAVVDLAAVARMCGVSRARVSKVAGLLGIPHSEQEQLLKSFTE